MTEEEIINKVRAALPDAEITMTDLTGTKDHWQMTVVSSAFVGKPMMAQHRMVYDALRSELSGPIHALSLTTKTPT